MLIRSLALCALAFTSLLNAADRVPVVSHISVLSDKVPDVSSIEAWKKSFIKDGMTDEQKAMAVWRTVVMFQHQEAPPAEFLQVENSVHDPIKMANVYGYSLCSVASAHVQALARAAGLQARGWTINRHVVAEILWDGKWHLLDSSLIAYFPKADGQLAGVEEIVGGIKQWYGEHPEYKGNDAKLDAFMRRGGWRKGPDVLARGPTYDDNGWLPAATHGWSSTMQEYDGSTLFQSESGYSTGYQVNIQLRPGERLTRNWSNKGLHVNMDGGGKPGCLTGKTGVEALRYTPQYGDLAPGRIGNGTLEYEDVLLAGAESGVFEVRMPSSYVYLGGQLRAQCVVAPGGEIAIAFSDNNGLDWRPVKTITASGPHVIDLKPFVFRRYDYRLQFTFKGARTRLDTLRLTHDIQHSQRPLPALAEGANTITFQSGPQEGTITLEASTDLHNKGRQLVYTDFHPTIVNCEPDSIRPKGREGSITFPIHTPGDLARLRIHTFYRARDAKDAWEVQVSFDGGKTFRSIERLTGPYKMMGKAVVAGDVPPGTRDALVRYVGTQVNTAVVLNFRIDADYVEPTGGFRPVKVTYLWDENGAEKRNEFIATKPAESYTITCAAKPLMKSIVLELAP
jgi:hypothetical protein